MPNPIDLKSIVRTIPNFPIEGIEFFDVNIIFENVDAWREMIAQMKAQLQHLDINILVGLESRGF